MTWTELGRTGGGNLEVGEFHVYVGKGGRRFIIQCSVIVLNFRL